MQFAARQGWLQQVGSVHRPIRLTRAHQRVHFINEQDDFALRLLHFRQHGFQTFFEFAAIFGARDHGAKIQRHNALGLQRFRHIAIDDAERQALHNRGFAHTWFANQHRVVLGAAGKYLNRATNFLITANHRVKLALACHFRDVARVFLQRIETVFGVLAIDRAALADLANGLFQLFGFRPGAAQGAARIPFTAGKGDQHAVLRHKGIAGAICLFLGIAQDADDIGGEAWLRRRATAGYLRQARHGRIHHVLGANRVTPARADQAAGGPFRVIQQRLQQMHGRHLLVEFANGNGLRRLQKTAGAVGKFLDVHVVPLLSGRCPSPPNGQRMTPECLICGILP